MTDDGCFPGQWPLTIDGAVPMRPTGRRGGRARTPTNGLPRPEPPRVGMPLATPVPVTLHLLLPVQAGMAR